MVLNSYAKINLSLRINSKRKDGLHEIQSYFCLINLADKIKLKKIKEKKDKIFFKGPFSKLVNKSCCLFKRIFWPIFKSRKLQCIFTKFLVLTIHCEFYIF